MSRRITTLPAMVGSAGASSSLGESIGQAGGSAASDW
jgi:hypothetical protein